VQTPQRWALRESGLHSALPRGALIPLMPIHLGITLLYTQKKCWQNMIENIPSQVRMHGEVRRPFWRSLVCRLDTERERERECVCVCVCIIIIKGTIPWGTQTWTNCQWIYYIGQHTSSPRQGHYWKEEGSPAATIVEGVTWFSR